MTALNKERSRFEKLVEEFSTLESKLWNNLNFFKIDELSKLTSFYEDYLSNLEGMYPKPRALLEKKFYFSTSRKYKYKVKHQYKFHHYLFSFNHILEDRLAFFKIVIRANENWDKKNFNSVLKDYIDIDKLIINVKERLTAMVGWYRKCLSSPLNYGTLSVRTKRFTDPRFAAGLNEYDITKRDFEKYIEKMRGRIKELEALFQYSETIKSFNEYFKKKSYNLAFDNYIKAENYKNQISAENLAYFSITEKEKSYAFNFAIVSLDLTNRIKSTVLDLGTKFTRIEIREIREKCKVESAELIVHVIKQMINNNEIYAEYFLSTNAIAFDQQANLKEIDILLKKYEQWDKEENFKLT